MCTAAAHHLTDTMEALPMKTKRLLKQDSVFHGPLVGEWREVWQVRQRFLDVVFVPKQHAEGLFGTVAVLVFGERNVLVHCKTQSETSKFCDLSHNAQLPETTNPLTERFALSWIYSVYIKNIG